MSYSKVFTSIRGDVVEVTKDVLVRGGIWKDIPDKEKERIMREWVEKCAAIYGFKSPKLRFIAGEPARNAYNVTGGGCYKPATNQIEIYYKASLVTLLHEFRHAMQFNVRGLKLYREDKEEDARGWSVSLFKKAAPKTYKRARVSGALHFS